MENDNIKTAMDAGAALANIHDIEPDGLSAPIIVVPTGYKTEVPSVERVEAWLVNPLRKKGEFHLSELDSFIRYFNEHKTDDSRIFATITDTGAYFEGVLNFHGKQPAFGDHRCTLKLTPTHEWNVWLTNNKVKMTQADFAQFLEDNADMFTEPTGANLLEIVQTLEGKSHVNISQAVKLQNGQLKLTYTEDVELKGVTSAQAGEMILPMILNVGIAPFQGVTRYAMKARLRYRIENRKITLWYEVIDAHLFVRDVCNGVLTAMEKQTGITPFKSA
jgi:uncharacterized protein YfdQ (DUF2303 family)